MTQICFNRLLFLNTIVLSVILQENIKIETQRRLSEQLNSDVNSYDS